MREGQAAPSAGAHASDAGERAGHLVLRRSDHADAGAGSCGDCDFGAGVAHAAHSLPGSSRPERRSAAIEEFSQQTLPKVGRVGLEPTTQGL
jgi:hypothetical protein